MTTASTTPTDDLITQSLEARARPAARRVGLKASKSRWRANSIDNRGASNNRPHAQLGYCRGKIRGVASGRHRLLPAVSKVNHERNRYCSRLHPSRLEPSTG
jgi:hypothetical protein